LAVATLVGRLKGASSHHVNRTFVSDQSFAWQAEYGVFTFSEKALPRIVRYVENQKIHHGESTLMDTMEVIEPVHSTNGE
jgi:putative transposase